MKTSRAAHGPYPQELYIQPPWKTGPKKREVLIKIQEIRKKEIKKKNGAVSRLPTIWHDLLL